VDLVPVDSLHADTTYVVTLPSGVQDRRSNPFGIPVALGFSTGSEIDENVLVGRVVRSGKPVARAGVYLFIWNEERETDPEVDVPYRQTESDADGNFVMPFLRPATRAYQLFAYSDANRTGAFEEGDPAGFFPEPVTVPALPETTGGTETELQDSGRTGSIRGSLRGDWESEGVLCVQVMAPGDSAATVSREVKISQPGPFRLDGISPGKYLLRAYQDVNDNQTWDKTEEIQEPGGSVADTLEVEAGGVVRGLILRPGSEEEH